MSELKAFNCVDSDLQEFCEPRFVYLKSEADKVIAELSEKHKTEVKELLCLIRDKEKRFNRAFDSEEKEIRYQKYKRCLNNAWWCLREEFYAEDCHCERWVDWAIKWHKRWLKLAEKFKDGK